MKTENSCYNCPNRTEACHDTCEVYKAWKAEYQRKEKEETKTTITSIIGVRIDVHGILRKSMLQFQQIKRCGLFCEKEWHSGVRHCENRKRKRSE